MSTTPRDEYERRRRQRLALREALGVREALLGNGRVFVFLVEALLACLIFWRRDISAWWLVPPALVFLGLVIRHRTVRRFMALAELAAAFYERGLARLDHRWAGAGQTGARYL